MARAGPRGLSFLADHCRSMRELKQVHAQMLVTGRLLSDAFAASRVLAFAALHPAGDISHALLLFSSLPYTPSPFLFNTLVRALPPTRALRLFSQMLRLAVSPGRHTFPFVLKAAANLHSSPATTQLHAQVLKHGLGLELYVLNGLVRSYACCGMIDVAREVFDECPERRNVMVWTTMVCGYAQNFCSSDAMLLFEEMMKAGMEPCGAALSSVLSACGRAGGLELGRKIHLLIEEKGIERGVILGTALVDMYAKNGELSVACILFDKMRERNTATWNAMICGLAHHGDANGALKLFWEMEKGKMSLPNNITFVGVLSACCHAGLVEVGRRIFHSMKAKHKIEPNVEHYGCIVNLLGQSGRLVEAEELIRGMNQEADVVVWGGLLTACKNHGNIEVAERVVKEMLKLEPDNHGVYVVLSNMYAEAGRWKDVVRLRKVMRNGGLKKIPGWSCVDGDDV